MEKSAAQIRRQFDAGPESGMTLAIFSAKARPATPAKGLFISCLAERCDAPSDKEYASRGTGWFLAKQPIPIGTFG